MTFLLPALNEAPSIANCVIRCRNVLQKLLCEGEVIVVDNSSTDETAEIAAAAGARVVTAETRGYGAAISTGLLHVKTKYTIMADADGSYAFEDAERFYRALDDGYDLVVGNRFQGGIAPGAMPVLNRWLGNPVLSGVGRLLFRLPVKDLHCGLRGFRTESIVRLPVTSTGMEFASEMIIRSHQRRLKMTEVPTTLSVDDRKGPPHLRPWRDGWRHLKLMLRLFLDRRRVPPEAVGEMVEVRS